MGMWNAAMATRDYDWSVEEHESLSSMRERLALEGPTYLSHVHDVVEHGRVDDTFVDALCEPAEVFTYGGMIAHVLTFAAHRRTLVVLAFGKHGLRGARLGRPDALGGRARRLTDTDSSAIRTREIPQQTADESVWTRRAMMGVWKSRSCWSPSRCWCSRARRSPRRSGCRRRCC